MKDGPDIGDLINQLVATQMLQGLRIEALQKMTLEALAQLGVESVTHPNLRDQFEQLVRDAADRMLAGVSDDDPELATALKRLITEALEKK